VINVQVGQCEHIDVRALQSQVRQNI
jgi:hypothetical protein